VPLLVGVDRAEIFLIKPTKYADDGYLLRHWRGSSAR
jgi:hypothetical protein